MSASNVKRGKNTAKLKYCIKDYASVMLVKLIQNKLGISESTYYRNVNAKIGSSSDFKGTDLIIIANLLRMRIDELFTAETKKFYTSK